MAAAKSKTTGKSTRKSSGARRIEGARKQAMETGRNRLLVTGIVLSLAFAAIGVRLVDLTVFQAGGEPRLAQIEPNPEVASGRADIVDRNGILLATSLLTILAGLASGGRRACRRPLFLPIPAPSLMPKKSPTS